MKIYEWELHLERCVLCNIGCGIKLKMFKLSSTLYIKYIYTTYYVCMYVCIYVIVYLSDKLKECLYFHRKTKLSDTNISLAV
jgi:hypothetical protein